MSNLTCVESTELTAEEMVFNLQEKLVATRRLLWSVVKTAGGELAVSREAMEEVDDTCVIEQLFSDPRSAIIVRAYKEP